MSRDPKYDILFEPVRLGPKETPNRFYQAPYAIGVGCESPAAQAAFRAIRAEGGWGVVGTGYCSIHPESDDAPRLHVHLWDEDDVRALALLCDAVHEHGALASVELHYGPGSGYDTRLPVRETAIGKDEISELEALYAVPRAGRRRPASTWSTSRFWLETLEQVRDAVGDSCAVTARLCLDTLDDGRPSSPGRRLEEEGLAFVALADHLADFWDVQVGDGTLGGLAPDAGPSRYRPENWQRPWVERVRPATAKPIAGVGRFTNADRMVEAVRSGQLDLIGSARGSIADPFLPRKIEEGRLDDIRECIGCNMCASRVNQGVRIVCTQNATAGEEYRRGWHPEKLTTAAIAENDVLVVGAGPAGLECATILGKRGMRRVHIVDAAVELGGSLRWISRLPGLGEWGRVVNYRKIQIDKLKNVEFIPNTRLEPDDVLEYGAEIVVVATGSRWAGDGRNPITGGPIPGADAAARTA